MNSMMVIAFSFLPIFGAFGSIPRENRTKCQDLLTMNGPFGPIKEGYEQISFHAKGVKENSDSDAAIQLTSELLTKMTAVLESNGLADGVLFVDRDFHSSVNPLALELLAKGVTADIVENFHPNWENSHPSRHIFWDIRDPLYLVLKCQVRKDVKWFDIWIKSDSKEKILKLMRGQIPDGVFLDGPIPRLSVRHLT